jgi:predicted TIM-barrel fold metal-dependent hydrolase
MDARMSKLKIPNIDEIVAIDIHTHAEEPCGMHGDDGYDDFQAQMAEYFKSPNKHPPTVPETAAYYRAKKIAAVIFPVDAERETGFRRYNNYEMLELAAENSDVLIPFVSIDPHKGKLGVREARKLIEEYGVKGFNSIRPCRASIPTTAWPIRFTKQSMMAAPSRCFTPARPASAPACLAAWGCG